MTGQPQFNRDDARIVEAEQGTRYDERVREREQEGDDDLCSCGSGEESEWAYDGNGIPLCRVCPQCEIEKLSRYRREILRPYTQADIDEPMDEDE